MQPSPFRFEVEELTLKFGERVILHDEFQRSGGLRPMEVEGRRLAATEGPRYRVDVGRVTDSNIRDGVFSIDQTHTSNTSVGPMRFHRQDLYVAMLTLPRNLDGDSTFVAREGFGLEYSIRLRSPRFSGFERLKIGLAEAESMKALAALSVGRLPTPIPPFPGPGGPGDPKIINVLEQVSNPAIVLGRVEEPDVRGEIVLDHGELEPASEIETLELVLRVGRQGELSGVARISAAGQVRQLELTPRSQEPREFFGPRSRLPADAKLAATVFIETLPKPEVQSVDPSEIGAQSVGTSERTRFRIQGIGFGPDARVEVIPEGGGQAEPIRADAIQLERAATGPEGTVLLVEFGLLDARVRSYALRVTTGGQSSVLRNAVRVF
jgi:hypothetical protein